MSQAVDELINEQNSPEVAHQIRKHLYTSSSKNIPSAHWAQQCIEECRKLAAQENYKKKNNVKNFKKKDLCITLLLFVSLSIALYCALKLPKLIEKIQQLYDEKIVMSEEIREMSQQLPLTNELRQELRESLAQQQTLSNKINNLSIQLNHKTEQIDSILTNIQNLESEINQSDHSHTTHINQLHNEVDNLQQLYTARIETCTSEYGRMIQELNAYSQNLCRQAPVNIKPMSFTNRLSSLFSRETIRDISHATSLINTTSQAVSNTQSAISSVGNMFDTSSHPHETLSSLSNLPSVPQTNPYEPLYAT